MFQEVQQWVFCDAFPQKQYQKAQILQCTLKKKKKKSGAFSKDILFFWQNQYFLITLGHLRYSQKVSVIIIVV